MNLSSLLTIPELTDPQNIEANRLGQITQQQRAANSSILVRFMTFVSAFQAYAWMIGLDFVAVMALIFLPIDTLLTFILIGLVLLAPVIFLGIRAVKGFLKLASIKGDLEQGRVEHADGKLAYGKAAYEAVTLTGEKLELPRGWTGLTPGIQYRFYYLQQSRTVISAEAVREMSGSQALEELQQSLASANRFTVEDVRENRSGTLTTGQVRRLLPKLITGLAIAVPSLLLLSYVVYSTLIAPQADSPWPLLGVLIFIIVGGVFAVIGAFQLLKAAQDILTRSVLAIEGDGQRLRQVSRSSRNSSSTITYYYQVGDQKVRVPERAYHALINGLRYRMYYSPRSQVLMSIEPLQAPTAETAGHPEEERPWTQFQTN